MGPAGERTPRPDIMKRRWEYWRLMDRTGHIVGYMRQCGAKRQYAGPMDDCWHRVEIPHADSMRIDGTVEGFRFLTESK